MKTLLPAGNVGKTQRTPTHTHSMRRPQASPPSRRVSRKSSLEVCPSPPSSTPTPGLPTPPRPTDPPHRPTGPPSHSTGPPSHPNHRPTTPHPIFHVQPHLPPPTGPHPSTHTHYSRPPPPLPPPPPPPPPLHRVSTLALLAELRSCVKVDVAVLGSPSLISLMVSVDVKQH